MSTVRILRGASMADNCSVKAPRTTEIRSVLTLVNAHARRTTLRVRPVSHGVPVLLIPGLMAGDWTMSLLATRLEQQGHPSIRARIGINIGCTRELVDRLEERLVAAARHHQSRVAIVGWSRGGCLAKIVTTRRPALVAGLTTLASPTVDPLDVSPQVERQIRVLSWLNAVGARGVLGADCLSGECAAAMTEELRRPFPAAVPFTAFYSKHDSVVHWRACCDPDAELVEVGGSHLGIGTDPAVISRVVDWIARLDGQRP